VGEHRLCVDLSILALATATGYVDRVSGELFAGGVAMCAVVRFVGLKAA
jgi:hypothetical protein